MREARTSIFGRYYVGTLIDSDVLMYGIAGVSSMAQMEARGAHVT